jgi:hypothetical protein
MQNMNLTSSNVNSSSKIFGHKTNSKNQAGIYVCLVCNKSFKEKVNLKIHERIHVSR